jgi:hypothetical protein
VINHGGKAHFVCLDCGIIADIEAIGGHCDPASAMAAGTTEPVILNQPSPSMRDHYKREAKP